MSTVTSAYNFVPINKKVCLPEWADAVSQDVPLQDAVSGVIDLTITAKTPIFVRGKSTVPDPNKHQEYEFMKHNGQYCIPGSSIKGTIANVLEILSFGKLNRINDHRFSQRDWENKFIYKKSDFARNKGGWLYYKDGEYKIKYSTRKIGRIEHEAIDDSHYGTRFEKIFGEEFDISTEGKKDEEKAKAQFLKSARKKYELLGIETFKFEKKFCIIDHKKNLFEIDENGYNPIEGTLIVTGQSNQRKFNEEEQEWEGKNKEFIFWKSNKTQNVDNLIEDFLFAYFDDDPKQRTTDWEHWRTVLDKGGKVPVFLQLDDNNKIKHFGLSMLYKLPFDQRVKKLLDESHYNKKKYDLAETLFGYSIDKKSTKGRVNFQHAFADEFVKEGDIKTLVLGEPKASYYPFYIPQEFRKDEPTKIKGKYLTYNDEVSLAGRKRYPVKQINHNLGADKSAFSTTFTPLAANTKLKSKIVYHNLLPVELGALLCALTFNGVSDCHHGIGMAKPYGYGAVSLDIRMDEESGVKERYHKAILVFRAYMEAWWQQQKEEGTWSESEQLQELIAMARFSHQPKKLTYMELGTFVDIKRKKKALPRFTKFLGIEPHSYPESYQKEIKALVEIEKQRLAAIEEANRLQEEAEEKAKAEKAAAEKKAKAEKVRKETLAKGLFIWLPKTNDYGLIAHKMNEWIIMRNEEFITDEEAVKYLLVNVTASRKKKSPKNRKTFFNDKKTNDLIRWIGKEEAEKFIQTFTNET